MTWEWATLLSVVIVCGTILALLWQKPGSDTPEIATSIDGIEERVSQLETNFAAVHGLAESTKKLLSEANLAKGFRAR